MCPSEKLQGQGLVPLEVDSAPCPFLFQQVIFPPRARLRGRLDSSPILFSPAEEWRSPGKEGGTLTDAAVSAVSEPGGCSHIFIPLFGSLWIFGAFRLPGACGVPTSA